MFKIWFHFISISLFPVSNNAYIHFHKTYYDYSFGCFRDMDTKRKVTFDYAIQYMVKHGMKMTKCKGYSGSMFESAKIWKNPN